MKLPGRSTRDARDARKRNERAGTTTDGPSCKDCPPHAHACVWRALEFQLACELAIVRLLPKRHASSLVFLGRCACADRPTGGSDFGIKVAIVVPCIRQLFCLYFFRNSRCVHATSVACGVADDVTWRATAVSRAPCDGPITLHYFEHPAGRAGIGDDGGGLVQQVSHQALSCRRCATLYEPQSLLQRKAACCARSKANSERLCDVARKRHTNRPVFAVFIAEWRQFASANLTAR